MRTLDVGTAAGGGRELGAIVELQRRYGGERVDGQELGLQMLAVTQVDRDGRYIDAFLGDEHAHSAR